MRNLALAVVLLSAAAGAEEGATKSAATNGPSLEVSLKAGGHFPQLTNKLGTSFDALLGVGYAPLANKQLQLFVELGYTQPPLTVSGTDPRLGTSGADYASTLVVQDLSTKLGVSYFFLPPSSVLLPYAGVAVRADFVRSRVTGSGGAAFGLNNETATLFGGTAFAGVGFHLGPGLLLGELSFSYTPIGQRVTGASNIGALSALLGYGVLL